MPPSVVKERALFIIISFWYRKLNLHRDVVLKIQYIFD